MKRMGNIIDDEKKKKIVKHTYHDLGVHNKDEIYF
jgi:hypothetical protein